MKTNKEKTKSEAIKALLKEVLCNSLAQATIKIFQTPHLLLKIFLFVSIIFLSVFASYLVIESILTYFSYGVSTTSRIIYESPTLFPQVTFCNVNWRTTKYAYEQKQKGTNYNYLSMDEKKMFSHNLSDILIECWFNGNDCNEMDLIWLYDDTYKNCFTFNSGVDSRGNKMTLKKSNLAGFNFGLYLKLYVNIYEKLLEYSNDFELGTIIRIGNSSYMTDNSNNDIFLSPGFYGYVQLEREFRTMLPKPYSNCEIDSSSPMFRQDLDLFNLIGFSKYDYSQQLCLTQCLQKKFIEKYNCTSYSMLSLYNLTQCESEIEDLIWSLDDSFDGNFINKNCLPSCPLECNQTLFKTSISFSKFIGDNLTFNIINNPELASDFINRTIDANAARESFVAVSIYYNSLSYMETTEASNMNIASLLASIGGSLSLFLGVSVFSLCELVEVLIEIYFLFKKQNITVS